MKKRKTKNENTVNLNGIQNKLFLKGKNLSK